MISKKVQVLAETIQRLLQCSAFDNLKNVLAKAHQADIAMALGSLDAETQAKVFSLLATPQRQASVLSEIELAKVAPLLELLGFEKAGEILTHVPPDDVADILEELPEELSQAILARLKREEAEEVEELIRYSPDTAGGIMSPEVFSLSEALTVREAIEKVQQAGDVETVFYVYVTNPQGHLVGVLSLKKLILAKPERPLGEIMEKDPVRVRVDVDQEEVARIVSRYNYLSVPVVDAANKLVGVVTVDDVIDVIREEATEDILLISGADKEAMEKNPVRTRLKKRLPLFLILLVGGILVSELIRHYLPIPLSTQRVVGFLPLLLVIAGSLATQSMTIVISTLSVGRAGFKQVWEIMAKEFLLAVILGLLLGFLLALFIMLRHGLEPHSAGLFGFLLLLAMVMAVGVGTTVPFFFQKGGLDPAIATVPFVTILNLLFCLWVYFALTLKYL